MTNTIFVFKIIQQFYKPITMTLFAITSMTILAAFQLSVAETITATFTGIIGLATLYVNVKMTEMKYKHESENAKLQSKITTIEADNKLKDIRIATLEKDVDRYEVIVNNYEGLIAELKGRVEALTKEVAAYRKKLNSK